MPWVRVDDHFDEHPKMAAVGPVGWGVWLAGLAYCNRNLTDGFIPYSVAEGIGGSWRVRVPVEEEIEDGDGVRTIRNRQQLWSIDIGSGMHGESITTEWVIEQLLRVGLWEEVEGGYRIHDYEDYQPSKAEVIAERKKWTDKKRRSRGESPSVSPVESSGDTLMESEVRPDRPVPVSVPVTKPVPSSVPVAVKLTRDPKKMPEAIGDILPRMNIPRRA